MRLSREHHHGLVMALRLQRELPAATAGEVGALYSDLARFWTGALSPHCEAEDEALLARLAAHEEEGLALAGRLQREHRDLEALIDGMRAAAAGDNRRSALTRFGALLGDHIRWEERELFPWVERCLAADLDAIGALLDRRLPEVPVACPTPQTL